MSDDYTEDDYRIRGEFEVYDEYSTRSAEDALARIMELLDLPGNYGACKICDEWRDRNGSGVCSPCVRETVDALHEEIANGGTT